MGNLHLVTGYMGQEHITAVDQAAFNAALIGTGQFVLDKGKVFEAQVISNNQIRVLDGELMMQGRFVRLNPDIYVDLTIENGTQGLKRNDLIVARYTKNNVTGVESTDLVVIKGTAINENPVDPEYTVGDITNGVDAQHDFPLWRIPLDGLNVGEPVALFGEPFVDSMRSLPEIRKTIEEIHVEIEERTKTYTVSVGATWTADTTNGGYYQTASVSGLLATDNPVVDIVLGEDVEANKLYKEAWSSVDRIVSSANSITLYANKDAPTVAFTIQLKVVR